MGKTRMVLLFLGAMVTTACDEKGKSDQPDDTSGSGESEGLIWREFDVDGAGVWAQTALTALPDRASVVRFVNITVIDEGNGPKLCLGITLDSLPPQCSGPRAEGLVMGDWTEFAGGTTWGYRTVTVRWPVTDGGLQVLVDEAPHPDEWTDPPRDEREVPPQCESIEVWMNPEVIANYAADHRDTTSVVWLAEPSKAVLQVSGDPDQVRSDLASANGDVCIERVDYSRNQLSAAQERLHDLFDDEAIQMLSTGIGAGVGVGVDVAVPDRFTAQAIVAKAGEPELVTLTGRGIIVE